MSSPKQLKSWFYKGGIDPKVYGRQGWLKQVERLCSPYSGLLDEHCPLIHSRLTTIRREFDKELTRLEFGLWYFFLQNRAYYWPYAAIQRKDEAGKVMFSTMLVPAVMGGAGISHNTYALPTKDGNVAISGCKVFGKWTAVLPDTSQMQGDPVALSLDDLGRAKGGVRPGDCWIMDTLRMPTVVCNGYRLGCAANFGSVREVLDTVRCRLTFAVLPSA